MESSQCEVYKGTREIYPYQIKSVKLLKFDVLSMMKVFSIMSTETEVFPAPAQQDALDS